MAQHLNVTDNERAAYSPSVLRACSALRNAHLRPYAYSLDKMPVAGKRGRFYLVMGPLGQYVELSSVAAILDLAREYRLFQDTLETLGMVLGADALYLSWEFWTKDKTGRDIAIMNAQEIRERVQRERLAKLLAELGYTDASAAYATEGYAFAIDNGHGEIFCAGSLDMAEQHLLYDLAERRRAAERAERKEARKNAAPRLPESAYMVHPYEGATPTQAPTCAHPSCPLPGAHQWGDSLYCEIHAPQLSSVYLQHAADLAEEQESLRRAEAHELR